jgi:hypothetical protein
MMLKYRVSVFAIADLNTKFGQARFEIILCQVFDHPPGNYAVDISQGFGCRPGVVRYQVKVIKHHNVREDEKTRRPSRFI